MNTLFRGVVVFVLMSAVFCTEESLCSMKDCMSGELCCQDVMSGPQCYNASMFSCPLGSRGSILCGFQEHGEDFACALRCYDAVDYVCCGDVIYNRNASNVPWSTCVNPHDSTTSNDNSGDNNDNNGESGMMCGNTKCATKEFQCCNDVNLGPQCFDPSIYSCPSGSSGTILCGFQENGEDFACGTVCYDNVTYICCNDVVYSRDAINIPWDMCDEDNSGNNGNSGNSGNSGNNGGNDSSNGGSNSGSNGGSSNNNGNNGGATGSNQGGDQSGSSDMGSTTGASGMMCGNTMCATSEFQCCNDVSLGPQCYDPSIYSCPSGSSGTILCGFQEHGEDFACGTVCFDNVTYICCNDVVYSRDATNIPWDMCDEDNSGNNGNSGNSNDNSGNSNDNSGNSNENSGNSNGDSGITGIASTGSNNGDSSDSNNGGIIGSTTGSNNGDSSDNNNGGIIGSTTGTNNGDSSSSNNGGVIGSTTSSSSVVICGNAQCAVGNECCNTLAFGMACFATSQSYCAQGLGGFLVCNVGELVCNMTCYDPNNFFCDNDLTLASDGTSNVVSMIYLLGTALFAMLFSL